MILKIRSLKREIKKDQYNLKLRLSLANLFILENELEQAINELNIILTIDKRNKQARVSLYFYLYALNYPKSKLLIKKLDKKYKDAIFRAEDMINKNVFYKPFKMDKSIIIVLGNKLNEDMNMSEILLNRLEITYKHMMLNPDALVILSGGLQVNNYSEADKMYLYLLQRGIEKYRLIKEDRSKDSFENVYNCLAFLKNNDNILLISDNLQIKRAKVLLNELAFKRGFFLKINGLIFDEYFMNNYIKCNIYRDLLRCFGFKLFPHL